ncbi:MAG: TonB-dependent receptor, partial [Bacteroidota bacterium]
MKQFIFLLIISTILIYPAKAQNAGDSEPDTLKTYRLGEVVATDFKERGTILPSVINKVTYHEIRTSDAASVSQLEAFIPSAFIQTNSRGQTLLFIRGAGERQLGLFFDGALANIPWDNRMDISLIPADIISSINVIKGAGSILYGPNVLGGAVNISTVERSQPGFGAIGRVQAGDGNSQFYSLTHDARIGHFNYIANVSYNTSAGDIVSGNAPADLTNVRENSSLLMNSDRERLSAYARGEYQMDGTTLGLSVNYIDASQGVTP